MRRRIALIAASIAIALATLQTAAFLSMAAGAHRGMAGMDTTSTCPISGSVVCLEDIAGVLHHVNMVQDMLVAVPGIALALAVLACVFAVFSFALFDARSTSPGWRIKRGGELLQRALSRLRRWLSLHNIQGSGSDVWAHTLA